MKTLDKRFFPGTTTLEQDVQNANSEILYHRYRCGDGAKGSLGAETSVGRGCRDGSGGSGSCAGYSSRFLDRGPGECSGSGTGRG